MADPLRERTARLLTDFLEYCARAPGSPARAPSTPEAEVLRYVATQVQQSHQQFLSNFRGYRQNRVALVGRLERYLLPDPQNVSWGYIAALLIFAGTLLERPPPGNDLTLKPDQEQDLEWETNVDQDCQRLVALLCDRLMERHRAWLEAHNGWDGFCLFFSPLLPYSWKTLLVQALLSCVTVMILIYLLRRLS
ncbi:bcl-2-like protein 10 [Suricata suricatta]|uniref:Bcl-2-like protein 10 n=1 Tax=Suricata suricatta TaxID=37032 RepID=A0A673UC80_SURSU|nr:bcl-2-like protein 10 [Suricata suricatta]